MEQARGLRSQLERVGALARLERKSSTVENPSVGIGPVELQALVKLSLATGRQTLTTCTVTLSALEPNIATSFRNYVHPPVSSALARKNKNAHARMRLEELKGSVKLSLAPGRLTLTTFTATLSAPEPSTVASFRNSVHHLVLCALARNAHARMSLVE